MKTTFRALALLAAFAILAPAGAAFANGTDSIPDDEETGTSVPDSSPDDDQDEVVPN